MIVRDFNTEKSTPRRVADKRWESVRLLLKDDGMGFSFHITTIEAGSTHVFEYRNHFESVYCIAGSGRITELATGKVHTIRPGVMYALNLHDRHELVCDETFVLACCFNPPLTGKEVHGADGAYALAAE